MQTESNWWTPGSQWLQAKADEHFRQWAESRDGAKWRRGANRSPYDLGYRQPDWIREAIEALGRNDEIAFKAIKLANL